MGDGRGGASWAGGSDTDSGPPTGRQRSPGPPEDPSGASPDGSSLSVDAAAYPDVVTPEERHAAVRRRDLEALSALVDTGCEKGAAHRLGIARSSLDRRLLRLREEADTSSTMQLVWTLRHDLEAHRGDR